MHNIEFETYPLKVDRKDVERSWDEYVAHEDWQEGATCLPNHIRWIEDGISDSYDEAEKRIEKLDRHCYDQLAVKYKEYKPCKTKKYEKLRERFVEAFNALREKKEKVHYSAKNISSEYVGCRHCGSKIATKYIDTNVCPVCRTDMRPASVLQAIKKAEEKKNEIGKLLEAEQKKGKYEVRWLVKIEYHT